MPIRYQWRRRSFKDGTFRKPDFVRFWIVYSTNIVLEHLGQFAIGLAFFRVRNLYTTATCLSACVRTTRSGVYRTDQTVWPFGGRFLPVPERLNDFPRDTENSTTQPPCAIGDRKRYVCGRMRRRAVQRKPQPRDKTRRILSDRIEANPRPRVRTVGKPFSVVVVRFVVDALWTDKLRSRRRRLLGTLIIRSTCAIGPARIHGCW